MILFQKRFHEGIVSGAVTLTFRAWPSARVKPGGRYRCHPIGVLEVDAIDKVLIRDITDEEARASGFDGRAALVAYIGEQGSTAATRELFRIRFHHGGDGDRVPLALMDELGAEDARALADKLAKMDARSEVGPWTKKTLALIAKHPRVAASVLATKLGRDKMELKADIVKLKKLGLTQSFEVGYEVSPRGRAFLALKAKRRATR
ncbi:MAG TPA: hypothetical protein VL400_00600 [Polyangiaceae bacterium]|nr:hypothetical protein [Polyangiaceae bacterium]